MSIRRKINHETLQNEYMNSAVREKRESSLVAFIIQVIVSHAADVSGKEIEFAVDFLMEFVE